MQPSGLSFYHLGIAPKMLQVLERMKFVAPTPIQHKAIPIALENKDLVGIAQTGTGKTLAFGIPIVQRLNVKGGRALVLVPTRELALQVDEAIRKILHPFSLTSVVLIGGAPMFSQVKGLRKNPDILIATPGRLIDHLEQETTNLNKVNVLVLDEADRMLDMGFAPQVHQILRRVPRKRQTMLFSATMPIDIVNLATQHMKLPINVEIAPSGTAAEKVSQELFIVKQETKKAVLRMLLKKYRGAILVFIRTKRGVKKVTRMVREMGHKVAEIHSDRTMGQRKQAILGFKTGRYRVLIATDVAARGIDVSGIELVINHDLPDDIENYVHRIGRTGRAGEEGHAISFACPDQGAEVEKIERLIRKTLPRGKHPEFPPHPFTHQTQKSAPRSHRGRGHKSRFSSSKRKRRHRKNI